MNDEDLYAITADLIRVAGWRPIAAVVNGSDVQRFSKLYTCRDPSRLAALIMLRSELEHRIYARCTDVFREDIVRRYTHSPDILMQPYSDHLESLNTGRKFSVRSWAQQIAMFDVAQAVRDRVDGSLLLSVRERMDTLLGELVDKYGEDTDFYALVRSSPLTIRSRFSFTPGGAALFRDRPSASKERRTMVEWMEECPRTPIGPFDA